MPLALAGLNPVMMGLFALLLVVGIILLVDLLHRAIDAAGVPGFLAGPLHAFVNGVRGALESFFAVFIWVAKGAISLVTAPARAFLDVINALELSVWRLGNAIRDIVYRAIPGLWSGIVGAVGNAVNSLVKLINAVRAQAIAYADAIRLTLARAITAAIATAAAHALGLAKGVYDTMVRAIADTRLWVFGLVVSLDHLIRQAVTDLIGWMAALELRMVAYVDLAVKWAVATAIGVAVDQAGRYADAVIGAYGRAVDALAATAAAKAWPHILDAIDSIVDAIPGSLADVFARAGAIPRVSPRTLAATAAAAVAVGTIALDWVARCGTSLCRNVLGFGDELAALDEEILIAAILELAAAALVDPHDTAADIGAVLRPGLTEAAHDFTSVLATV